VTTRADERRGAAPSAAQFGTFALIAIGYAAAAVLALHVLDADLDPVHGFMSEYAVRDYGWLMRSAFFAVGLGAISIALGLRASLAPGWRVTLTVLLMAVAGAGFVVAGIVDADIRNAAGEVESTAPGIAHDLATFVSFICLIVAAFVLHGLFGDEPRWRSLAQPALWFAIAMALSRAVMIAVPEDGPGGLSQRLFAAIMMLWLGILAWRLRRVGSLDRGSTAEEMST
jgi:hypothetical protein